MNIMTSRAFNQDVSKAKREAAKAPVFITDRGRPSHVLMSYEAYRKLTADKETIVDLLAQPDVADVDLAASRLGGGWDRRESLD